MTESVTESSAFSKAWGHSDKHESFTINGSEGVYAGDSFWQSLRSLIEILIGNGKCYWVFFSKLLKLNQKCQWRRPRRSLFLAGSYDGGVFSEASGLWYKFRLWWMRALMWTEKKSGLAIQSVIVDWKMKHLAYRIFHRY